MTNYHMAQIGSYVWIQRLQFNLASIYPQLLPSRKVIISVARFMIYLSEVNTGLGMWGENAIRHATHFTCNHPCQVVWLNHVLWRHGVPLWLVMHIFFDNSVLLTLFWLLMFEEIVLVKSSPKFWTWADMVSLISVMCIQRTILRICIDIDIHVYE